MSFLDSIINNVGAPGAGGAGDLHILLTQNGAEIDFPILPENFEVTVAQLNETANINNLGEANLLGKTGLRALTISAFFPAQAYSFCVTTPRSDPYSYVKTLDSWRTSGKPCNLTITTTAIDFPVAIQSFKYGERDGTGDVYFSLDLKEYVYLDKTGLASSINKKTGLRQRPESFLSRVGKNIKFYPGDSLGDVVGRAMGKSVIVNNKQYSQLEILRAVKRHGGGIKPGSTIKVNNTGCWVGGINVLPKK